MLCFLSSGEMTLANFTVQESILEGMLKNTTKNIGDVDGLVSDCVFII